ncbi:MAG: hypothetical protein WAP48_01545 [Sediminibacterium sp.]
MRRLLFLLACFICIDAGAQPVDADIWTYPSVSFPRVLPGSGVIVFSVYLIMRIVQPEYAKRSLLSGFPPPKSYSIFVADYSLINRPVGYTPDANAYGAWLECGIEAMKKLRYGHKNAINKNL